MNDRIPFNDYWQAMKPNAENQKWMPGAEVEWDAHPEKHKPIMRWLKRHGSYPDRNPYYFIHDFTVSSKPAEPTFLRGDEPGDLVQVKYGDRIKICTRATMELFGLEWVRDWNS